MAQIVRKFTDEAVDVCKFFDSDPNAVYPEGVGEMPADTSAMDTTGTADASAMPIEPVAEVAPADLKKQLDDFLAGEDVDAKDKKTAEELKARLEELEKAEQNATDFLASKAVPAEGETAPVDAGVAPEMAPAV